MYRFGNGITPVMAHLVIGRIRSKYIVVCHGRKG